MPYPLNEAKTNPSSNYPTSAPTLGARPLALVSEHAEGRRLSIQDENLSRGKSKRIKRVAGRRSGTSAQLSNLPRTIT